MKNSKRKYDVFISYTRKDREVAEFVNTILNRSGIKTFFEFDSLEMGMEYAFTITNLISNCRMVVAIISESSLNSPECRKEINYALANEKPIVCILVDKSGQLKIPFDIQDLRFVDYDSILDNPKQLLQIINETSIHKGDSASPIAPNIDKQSNKHVKESHSSKPVKVNSKKPWLKWVLVIVTIISASVLFMPWISSLPQPSKPSSSPSSPSSFPPVPQASPSIFLLLFILILVIALIVLIVLLVVSRRRIKQLSTNLNIVSDAKLLARLGNEDKVIEKENNTSLQLPVGMHQMNLNYSIFNSPKRINCFIAGSTSLQTERDALRATISLVCNRWKEKNFQIFSFTYEDFERKFAPNGQQSLYDYFIENEANVAVFLIKGEIGDFTITEFNKAYKSFKDSNRPSIIVYYDRSSELNLSALELKKRVQSIGQYWVDYNTLNEMKYHFQEVLSTDLWTLYEKELSVK